MTAPTRSSTCILCGSERSRSPLGGALRRCPDCDFTWTSEPTGVSSELYGDDYFSGGGYEDYFQPSARRFEARLRIKWLLGFAQPRNLLEAGSAAGFFLEAAVRAGIAAQGIEMSAGPTRYAREELGMQAQQGDFESNPFHSEFDAVCAFHVLEHVDDPRRFLSTARTALAPGGLLAIEVPNISAASARRLGASWPHLQLAYHQWHFNPRSLAALVTAQGFELIHQDTMVTRAYMPPRFRRRQARRQVVADLRDLRSLRLTNPERGDLIRLVARRPHSDRGIER